MQRKGSCVADILLNPRYHFAISPVFLSLKFSPPRFLRLLLLHRPLLQSPPPPPSNAAPLPAPPPPLPHRRAPPYSTPQTPSSTAVAVDPAVDPAKLPPATEADSFPEAAEATVDHVQGKVTSW